jgi:DNA-binding ferritin-like protein (Dps family)
MWISLFNEQRGWDLVLKDHVTKRIKQLFNNYDLHAKSLEKEIRKHIDLDEVSDDSEIFSRCIELIRRAQTVEDKKRLYAAMVYHLQDERSKEITENKE